MTPLVDDQTESERTDPSARRGWLWTAFVVGLLYFVVGIAFGSLGNTSSSDHVRVVWRFAAWVVSGVLFAAHIGYAQFRLRKTVARTALVVSMAAAFGSFDLAVAANIHSQLAAAGNERLLALSLILWPALTFVPAYVAALVLTAILARIRRSKVSDDLLHAPEGGRND